MTEAAKDLAVTQTITEPKRPGISLGIIGGFVCLGSSFKSNQFFKRVY